MLISARFLGPDKQHLNNLVTFHKDKSGSRIGPQFKVIKNPPYSQPLIQPSAVFRLLGAYATLTFMTQLSYQSFRYDFITLATQTTRKKESTSHRAVFLMHKEKLSPSSLVDFLSCLVILM